MSSFAYDPTMRVPKLPSGPVRRLPRQFAPARARRWPWLTTLVVLGALGLGGVLAIAVDRSNDARTAQADEVLRLLGR